MSENALSNVARVEMDLAPRVLQAETNQNAAASSVKQPAAREESPAQGPAAPKAQEVKTDKSAKDMSEITLKFKIDEKTNQVTIYLLDRASHKVVRSIPPEEMQKMGPGELLELFA